MICKYFLPFSKLSFHFDNGVLCCAEAYQVDVVSLVYFCFSWLCFWCQIQKIITKTDVKELVNTYIFFQDFCGFRSYIQFDSSACSSLVFTTPFIEEAVFPQCIFLSPLSQHRFIAHINVGLFLGSLLCSIDLYVCFCASYVALITVAMQYSLKSGSTIPPAFFFFLKIVLAVQGVLCFCNNFRIICSISVKNAIGILIRLH